MVHYCIAVFLESKLYVSPYLSNFLGFLFAFPVSYFGHKHFSFTNKGSLHKETLPKFLLVAITGFFLNQLLLIGMLNFTNIPFWITLGLVMVIVAVSTYLTSKYWAFKTT